MQPNELKRQTQQGVQACSPAWGYKGVAATHVAR